MTNIMNLIIFSLVILLSVIIPYITRKTESFGVSIPSDVYYETSLVTMRKHYAWLTGILGVLLLAGQWFIGRDLSVSVQTTLFVVALFAFLIGSFIMYLWFHSQMKHLKAQKDWEQFRQATIAVDTTFHQEKKTYSNLWFLLALLIWVGTLVLTFVWYDQIPEKIPMHFDFSGHVTDWAEKSYQTLLMFPGLQLLMTCLFIYMNMIIAHSRQHVDADQPESSRRQDLIFRKRWSAFTIITGHLLVGLFAYIQCSLIFSLPSIVSIVVSLGIVLLILIGSIALAVTTGQGGSRVQTVVTKKGQKINRDDDRYWKLGQFYYNPNDPSLWVEKRFGVGWTVNLAHKGAWVFLGIIIALVVLSIVLS